MKITNSTHATILRLLRKTSNKQDVAIWDSIAKQLEKSKHKRLTVNISRVNRHSKDGDTIIVPGKVLGSGKLDHKISIAAFAFSKVAREKLESGGGECLTIQTLIKSHPTGSGLKIIG